MLEDGRDLIVEIAGLAKSYPEHQFVLALPSGALDWKYLNDRLNETGACVDDLYALAIQPLTLRNIRHFLQAQQEVGRKLLEKLNDTQLIDLTGTPYFAIRLLQQANKDRYPEFRVPTSCKSWSRRLSQPYLPTKGCGRTPRKLCFAWHGRCSKTWPRPGGSKML